MLEPKRQIFARVVLPYAAFAALWISLSDWVLAFLISDPATITQLQTYKGLIFIGVTALLLYLLLHRQMDLRERAQREQERLRDRISAILESMTDGFVALDTGWRYTYVNRRGAELFDRTPEQLIGKSIWKEFPEGVGQKFHDAYHQALATQKTVYLEDYYPPWDRWFENRIYPSSDGMCIFFQDITERKRTEAQLQRMNRLYNTLSETSQAIVRAADSAVLFQQVCDIAIKFGGFRLAWIGLPEGDWFRVAAAAGPARGYAEGIKVSVRADLPEGQGPSGRTFRSGEHFICEDFSGEAGTAPWHERAARFGIASSAVFPLRQAGQSIGVLNIYAGEPNFFQEAEAHLLEEMAVDISFALDNMEQQKSLRKSEQDLEAIVENLPIIVFAKDAQQLRYVRVNRACEELMGAARADMLGKNDHDFFPPAQAEFFIAKDRETLAKGETLDISEEPIDTPHGRRLMHTRKVVVRDPDGRPRYLLGISEDITERRQAEAALHMSEALLRAFIAHTPAPIAMLDRDMRYLAVSRRWLTDYRLGEQNVIGHSHYEVFLEIPERWRAIHQRCLAGAVEKSEEDRFDRADGSIQWLRWEVRPWYQPDGAVGGIIIFSEDVTERKHSEEKLRENAHQLEILSRRLLAAQETERRNIARELHDEIGQLLTVIKLDLQTVLRQSKVTSLAPAVKESMEAIDFAVARVRDLSLDLRPSMLDDLGLVPTLRWYVQRQTKHVGVDISLDVPASPARATPDIETACFRVAQEALTNAVRHAAATRIDVTLIGQDDAIELTVRDNGKGFDVPVAHRHTMADTGFGLLGMQERTQLAGGELKLDSRPGAGTTVHARFPLTPPKAPAG